MKTPTIAITMGDPAGIGPEIVAKALVDPNRPVNYLPFVIGDAEVMQERMRKFGLKGSVIPVSDIPTAMPAEGEIYVLDFIKLNRDDFSLGKPHAGAGEVAYQSILKAVELIQAGKADAMVTAPICKESLHLAGHLFDGHTGLIAHLTDCVDYRMTFATEKLKITHVTAHMSLLDAIKNITTERVLKTIEIGYQHLIQLGVNKPRIAVCGLNPHASENGIFGSEDIKEVLPAVQAAQAKGILVEGPLPGDTTFMHAFNGRFDLVVAQYHDQGHIPGKLVAFDKGVNVTIGLPIIRTSVDHGTAFDIVETGTADHGNFHYAMRYALQMLTGSPK